MNTENYTGPMKIALAALEDREDWNRLRSRRPVEAKLELSLILEVSHIGPKIPKRFRLTKTQAATIASDLIDKWQKEDVDAIVKSVRQLKY